MNMQRIIEQNTVELSTFTAGTQFTTLCPCKKEGCNGHLKKLSKFEMCFCIFVFFRDSLSCQSTSPLVRASQQWTSLTTALTLLTSVECLSLSQRSKTLQKQKRQRQQGQMQHARQPQIKHSACSQCVPKELARNCREC